MLKNRLWRKTRSKQRCGLWYNRPCDCFGADGNRNFAFAFGGKYFCWLSCCFFSLVWLFTNFSWSLGQGTSSNACDDVYRGPSMFSEPETKSLSNFILSRNKTLKAYITLHSYGQYWLVPYGHVSPTVYPSDYNELVWELLYNIRTV